MSTEDNRQLMKMIFEGLAVGDSALFRASMADDFRVVVMGQSSWSGAVEGREALRRYFEYVRACFREQGRTISERFIADGDVVAVEARGDNCSTKGERYDNHYCLVFRIKNGKIAEMREYMDTAFCERVLGPYPVLLR